MGCWVNALSVEFSSSCSKKSNTNLRSKMGDLSLRLAWLLPALCVWLRLIVDAEFNELFRWRGYYIFAQLINPPSETIGFPSLTTIGFSSLTTIGFPSLTTIGFSSLTTIGCYCYFFGLCYYRLSSFLINPRSYRFTSCSSFCEPPCKASSCWLFHTIKLCPFELTFYRLSRQLIGPPILDAYAQYLSASLIMITPYPWLRSIPYTT